MEPIGFAAVVLSFSVPLAAIYAWYRVRKLRTEERLAAIAKGVPVPIADELPPHRAFAQSGNFADGWRAGVSGLRSCCWRATIRTRRRLRCSVRFRSAWASDTLLTPCWCTGRCIPRHRDATN